MNKKTSLQYNKGFSILALFVVAVVVAVGGLWLYKNKQIENPPSPQPTVTENYSSVTNPTPVASVVEKKNCGSADSFPIASNSLSYNNDVVTCLSQSIINQCQNSIASFESARFPEEQANKITFEIKNNGGQCKYEIISAGGNLECNLPIKTPWTSSDTARLFDPSLAISSFDNCSGTMIANYKNIQQQNKLIVEEYTLTKEMSNSGLTGQILDYQALHGSYKDVCMSPSLTSLKTIQNLNSVVKCYDSKDNFAVSASFKGGGYMCIDVSTASGAGPKKVAKQVSGLTCN